MIYFSHATDAFDALLNDTVDLHVQAVDHHHNLAGAGIRQRPVTIIEFRSPSPESGQPRFRRPEWSDSGLLAGIWPF